ncbi:MAG: NAD(P)-binding protein [Methanobacterium sp.]
MTFEVIVIGTGAGSATVAREISKKDCKVLILEKGKRHKMGTSINYLKNIPLDLKMDLSDEDVDKYDFLEFPAN